MSTIKDDIMKRLKAIAVNTGRLCLKLPHNIVNKTYIGQIIRCSSSASANYPLRAVENQKPILL